MQVYERGKRDCTAHEFCFASWPFASLAYRTLLVYSLLLTLNLMHTWRCMCVCVGGGGGGVMKKSSIERVGRETNKPTSSSTSSSSACILFILKRASNRAAFSASTSSFHWVWKTKRVEAVDHLEIWLLPYRLFLWVHCALSFLFPKTFSAQESPLH